ncbi:glycosyl hydrolase family 18 protein [Flavobacterium sp. ABG]|uniref:glycosyl hydrolase family 18 protein n=1 Tax=Flavobacterium sp. ABG TaxID=1423322 RepID=UPI00064A52E2|nr:glycosyl hydrolase family 18 protein [Flavobacterium sp. ABG]KLT71231.1 glycoside hydrolase [Flavobacterium sp. ABG]
MKHYYRLLFLFLLFPLLALAQPAHGKKVVGYYAQWAIYARDYNVPKIDGSKLTHLNYSFYGTTFDPARPENTKLKCLDTYADFEHTEGGIPWDAPVKGNFYDLKKLKEKYPHLKILISVGGWTKGQDLSPIAASPVARAALAADMANFIVTYPFIDGFDIDWEYPVIGGTDGTEVINGAPIPPQKHSPDDNKNLVYLLKAMRQAMPNKLVTIAAGNNVRNVVSQYLGPLNRGQYGMTEDISTYCDYITYFGYDFGGNWYDKTCYNAPLYASGNPNDPLYGASQSESLDELTNQYLNVIGFPANKLIMGLPYYGKIFKNVANNGTTPNFPGLFVAAPRDATSGCANPQPPAGTWDGPAACEKSGSIEICDLVGNPVTNSHPYLDPNTMMVTPTAAAAGWVRYFDNTTKVPYLYNAALKQFITYEDKQSMDLKVQYIKSRNLAGGMVWELSQDTRGAIPNSLLTQVDTSFGSIVPGTVSIAGSVKSGTALVPNVAIEVKNSSNVVVDNVVSVTGNFTFNNLVSGQNYTLTATKAAYNFTPVVLTNVTVNQTGVVIQGTQPLYTVSGTVVVGTTTTPVSGVTVTATSGTTVLTAVSSATGTYSITGLTAGLNFTVTAAKTGFPYTPASTVYNAISANQTLNFSQGSAIVYYTVSGTILNGTTPAAGVTVTATSAGAPVSAVSNASGAYSISLPSGSDYTVTAASAGKTYTPASTVYTNLIANKTLNFTEYNVGTNKISGTVKNGTVPVSGAKIELIVPWTDNAHGWKSVLATTDAQGNYSFANSVIDGYAIISSLKLNSWQNNEVTYLPSNLANFAVPTTPQVYNFNTSATAKVASYAINGRVLNGSTPVSGAVISAVSGTKTLTATTDSKGAYTFSDLALGSDYKVTAVKTGLTFVPTSTALTTTSGNKTVDFAQSLASTNLISGTVKNGSTPVSGAKVELVVPWTDNTHGWKSVLATTDAQGNFSYDNTVVAGYAQVLSLKLNSWQNGEVAYFPNNLVNFAMPTTPQVYNFNTQAVVVTKPVVAITAPTASAIAINLGAAINFVASVGLSAADATTISSVAFSLDGQSLNATNSSGTYTAIWTPVANQFSLSHTLTVTATASNGTTDSKTYSFTLTCSGANCPNQLPVITWSSPSNTTVYQSTFQVVPISVTAVDSDGSVSGVTITINGGTFNMTASANNTYTYNFTPTAYQDYPVVIKATDNRSAVTTLNNTVKIAPIGTNRFIPLPPKVILGYAHSWENAGAPFLYFSQMVGSKFNVVDYAFVETVNRDGYTPVLTTNDTRYLTNNVFNKQLLKNDIKSLRDSGVPVIVSIGGQNGHVVLDNVTQKNIFVNGLKAIIDEYQFDGVDIDFEGGSMNFNAGGLRDISYAGISAYPRLKNVVDACKELKAHYGPGFLLTAAPETQYVQGGYSTYNDTFGSFLPIIQNLRNELDLLAVQLYNTGGENGLDGQYYGSAKRANMVTALTDMIIKGYNIAGTGMRFDGLPASKVLIALPACPSAAGSGFITPAEGINAMHYLRTGTTFTGRTYTMQPGGPYPSLRGLMTWSVNWDASSCGNSSELSKAYAAYFASQAAAKTLSLDKIEAKSSTVAYFKNDALSVSNETEDIAQVDVFNTIGQPLVSHKNIQNNKEILIQNRNFTTKQLFVVIVTDRAGNKKSFKVMNFLN